jgi:phosphatidylserine/phosphatidylglycerophosphate/cardiolipin synthase-like enzyme
VFRTDRSFVFFIDAVPRSTEWRRPKTLGQEYRNINDQEEIMDNGLIVGAALLAALSVAEQAHAAPYLCDVSSENCRTRVISLIRNEKIGIDWSFWFATDPRYATEIVKRYKAGVRVRVMMDPRANGKKPSNATTLAMLKAAGIPMRMKSSGDICHWKGMVFAGQNQVEFSGANYSPGEYVPDVPYLNYQDEVIFFSDDASDVASLMTRFDDVWIKNIGYADYANITSPNTREYPKTAIAQEFNFPPDNSYVDRLMPLIDTEMKAIDITMYRITDSREVTALIRAARRGVRVRLYSEPNEYRNPTRLQHSYNVDRLYKASLSYPGLIQIRHRSHEGLNHQKTVIFAGLGVAVFGSSNWSTASDDNQLEVNYFSKATWFVSWFQTLFDRKWNNLHVIDGSPVLETKAFVPLTPGKAASMSPANLALGVPVTGTRLKWNGGNWAYGYDVYFGTSSNPPLYKANQMLGTGTRSIALPDLRPGTTYFWKIVSRTMADKTSTTAVQSFMTAPFMTAP